MWTPKGVVLIRGWRLFEARRLLKETRCPPNFFDISNSWKYVSSKKKMEEKTRILIFWVISKFNLFFLLKKCNFEYQISFITSFLFVCLFHWAHKNIACSFSENPLVANKNTKKIEKFPSFVNNKYQRNSISFRAAKFPYNYPQLDRSWYN